MLAEILDYKRQELKQAKAKYSQADLQDFATEQSPPRGFATTLRSRIEAQKPALIAEIKRASPSRGVLCETFEPLQIAQTYAQSGASCLSVLTDQKFFKGSGTVLDLVRRHCMLPALRKDFIVDTYQIYESRAIGADALLLIVAALPDDGLLRELLSLTRQLNMDALIEVHDRTELDRVLSLDGIDLVGINNRNLKTFEVSLETSCELAQDVPQEIVLVSESGIAAHQHIAQLQASGIYAYLVGEALMTADDPATLIAELLA